MKNFVTRFSSAFLVLALLLSMGVPALADDEPAGGETPGGDTPGGGDAPTVIVPERVSLNKNAVTLYLHDGTAVATETLIASVTPSTFNGEVTWESSDDDTVAVRGSGTMATVSPVAAGEADVTVNVVSGDVRCNSTCTVSVVEDTIKSSSFALSTLTVGQTADAGLTVEWESGAKSSTITYGVADTSIASVTASGKVTGVKAGSTMLTATVDGEEVSTTLTVTAAAPVVTSFTLTPKTLSLTVGESATLTATVSPAGAGTTTFTSNDASIATVNASGRVTGVKAGTTTIMARLVDAGGSVLKDAACTVTVSALSGNVSASAVAGTDLSFKTIYSKILDVYTRSGGADNPTLTFTSLGSSDVGTLYTDSNKSIAVNTSARTFKLMESMVFAPAAKGTYYATYTVTGSNTAVSGTITITVTSASKNIRIALPEDIEDYSFYERSSSGATGEDIIADAIGTYGSIKFGTITSGSSSGSLYLGVSTKSSDLVRSGTIVNKREVESLYFVPGKNATYQINYTAYSGKDAAGSVVASGTLSVGANADSLQVNISLNSIDDYRFNAATANSSSSAAAILRSAINANVGSGAWSYVRFDNKPATNTCDGELYTDSTMKNSVGTNFYLTSSELASLYFVPSQSGSFEIGYSVYSSIGSSSLASGKLRITVSGLAAGADGLYFTTTKGGTVSFTDKDFEDWFVAQRGSRYHLEYVRFTGVERSFGTLYYGNTKLTTGSGYNYYTEEYYTSKTSSSRYLSDVSYTAPSSTGYQEVSFVCYGRTSSTGSLVSDSGALRIYVTAGSVADVTYTYTGTAAILLQSSDFTSVYRNAMNVSTTSPKFYIQLLEIPDSGTMYYNYNTSTGRGTTLTSSNVDTNPFYVNGSTGADSLTKVAYVPASRAATCSVRYIAFSSAGDDLYTGTITFRSGTAATAVNVTDGYTFRTQDLFPNGDSSAQYVTFTQPLLGKLYVNYFNGRGTVLPANTRFYVNSASYGTYPLSALTFIPRSDTTGNIPLNYTVHTASSSYSGELTLTTNKKTASATFTDVTATDVGSWAANAIDFASKWGLVIGTGDKKFSPQDTMRRCDLVLILYRNAGSPAVSGTMPYTDVPAGVYYYNSALWAANNGIMNGVVTGKTYNPNGSITRQDFTRILYNYTGATGGSLTGAVSLSAYSDAGSVASYATDAMAWAVGRGYINGTSTTVPTLSPAATATRAQIATLLHRYLTL